MINEGIPQNYDIVIEEKNGMQFKFMCDSHETIDKFQNKKLWFSLDEFPTLEQLNRFIEKHFNKPQDWFMTNYVPAVLDALDRVSMALYGKIYSEALGQKNADFFGYTTLFWLLFLAKELNETRLPDIFSSVEPNKVN